MATSEHAVCARFRTYVFRQRLELHPLGLLLFPLLHGRLDLHREVLLVRGQHLQPRLDRALQALELGNTIVVQSASVCVRYRKT